MLVLRVSILFSRHVILEESFGLAIAFTSSISAEVYTLVNVNGPCAGVARETLLLGFSLCTLLMMTCG
jgi:hypothetical protein